jgi:hypothetical protein
MHRRLFAGVAVLSSIGFLATIGLAVRAQSIGDRWWVSVGRRNIALESQPRHVVFSTFYWRGGLNNQQGSGHVVYVSIASPSDELYTWFLIRARSETIVAVPYWMIGVATLLLPTAWLIHRRALAKRHVAGECVTCGYDLRASPDRCPECGAPVPLPPGEVR